MVTTNQKIAVFLLNLQKKMQVDHCILALSRYRRRKFDEAIESCDILLQKNYLDQAMWFIKCRSLTAKNWIDDTEMEDEGVADMLLDENSIANVPRPGTSFKRPVTGAQSGRITGIRPTTKDGRPITGFKRPGTSSRPITGQRLETAFQGDRPGTSRPVTSTGRFVRLGTASMRHDINGPFINLDSMDFGKYAKRPALAKALCDYLLYHDHNPTKALELAAKTTVESDYKDWWWKLQIGKCYYQLGLYREAEKQFKSALKENDMIVAYLLLCKVYLKLDQPNAALEWYMKASHFHPSDTHILLGIARIYDQLNDIDRGVSYYEKVLELDASNVEAIACLASNYFYEDQPEHALRLYRRLIQMGVNNCELWNNLGLCCFYASQYDLCLNCFERALRLADDDSMADVWYNIGQIAIGIGDLRLAYEAFKVAVNVNSTHAESFNNLGVLELRSQNLQEAKRNFELASNLSPYMHESFYNSALLAYRMGNYQESFSKVKIALDIYPEHYESQELMKKLKKQFN
jgi:tetratricopeptide repeat protein 8